MKKMVTFINNKGTTLSELLLSLLILTLISGLLTELLIYNISSSNSYSEYNKQQFTLQEAYLRLCKDIEVADVIAWENDIPYYKSRVILTIDGVDTVWELDSGILKYNGTAVIEGLTKESRFEIITQNLVVTLESLPSSRTKNVVNVSKPIIAQFALDYRFIN